MIRTIIAAVVFAVVMIAAPGNKTEKEIGTANASPLTETMTDLLFNTVREHPCAIVVMASTDSVTPLPKPKPHHVKSKVKKKFAHAPTKLKKKSGGDHKHHHSHHHHDSPKKISGALGPLHLTSPPGCV